MTELNTPTPASDTATPTPTTPSQTYDGTFSGLHKAAEELDRDEAEAVKVKVEGDKPLTVREGAEALTKWRSERDEDRRALDEALGLPAAYVPAPFTGSIVRVYGAQVAVVSGGVSVVSVAVNGGTPIATLTFTSGGAAGQVVTPGASDTKISALGAPVTEGDVISFTSDGGSADATVPVTFTAVLRRGM